MVINLSGLFLGRCQGSCRTGSCRHRGQRQRMATCPHAFSLLQNLSLIPSSLGTLPRLFVLASLITSYHSLSLTHVCIPVFTFMFSFYTLSAKLCCLSVLFIVPTTCHWLPVFDTSHGLTAYHIPRSSNAQKALLPCLPLL